jgi:hypothetical protein
MMMAMPATATQVLPFIDFGITVTHGGTSCARCTASRTRAKRVLWIATFVALSSVVFDYFER